MFLSNPEWRCILVPAFLGAQVLLLHATADVEHPPLAPAIAHFPAAFGPWRLLSQDTIDAATARVLNADLLVSQNYIETPTNSMASLLVAWFQTQREGVRQPHSPQLCLPGAGWTPRVTDTVTLETAAGAITVNRYIVDKGEQRAVVLYWYQTPRRVIAGEWAAKFWVAADALRDQRTDTALVRVIAWSTIGGTQAAGGDQAATAVAGGFARNLYPMLQAYLPR